jgi:hypothetical protein
VEPRTRQREERKEKEKRKKKAASRMVADGAERKKERKNG